ncbi:glycosyltransferase family protein [Nocardia asiatica]|uniref:glycosyltransferase family protein n=1 Tax=Nocardia asiatica TaxID=209252 RepID=UPI001C3F348E|nr:glycosyltransferase [Nocardia asiatica]
MDIPTVTYHLDLWRGLQRERDLECDPFYTSIGWFFTVDKLMADWFNSQTGVKGRFLPAGVYDQECYISDQPSEHANDVVFVGSRRYHPEHPWRHQLIDWLRETYGSRFTHVGGDGDTGTVRGDDLNRLYANSKVAVGDTLCLNFDYPYYASDRLWECAGRGGAQVFPRITGLEQWFKDGEHLLYFDFGDFDGLRSKIDWMLEHDEDRERIRRAGHEMVKASGTYRHRWQTILETVFA